MKGKPLSPQRLLRAVRTWLAEYDLLAGTRFRPASQWGNGRCQSAALHIVVGSRLYDAVNADFDFADGLSDFRDLVRCYGYWPYPGCSKTIHLYRLGIDWNQATSEDADLVPIDDSDIPF
jgi:hypothetical protein